MSINVKIAFYALFLFLRIFKAMPNWNCVNSSLSNIGTYSQKTQSENENTNVLRPKQCIIYLLEQTSSL